MYVQKIYKLYENLQEDQISSLALFLARSSVSTIPYRVLGLLEKSTRASINLFHTSPIRQAKRQFQGRRGPASLRAETAPKSIRGPIRYDVCAGYRLQCTQSFKLSREKPSNRLVRVHPVNQLNSLGFSPLAHLRKQAVLLSKRKQMRSVTADQ